jgi:uncharacterized membrane protein (UPF0127 family)
MARILIVFFFLYAAFASARDLDKLYKKNKFELGGHAFEAWVADDDGGRAQGLMFVEKLPENVGMLFVFESAEPRTFWMKNTLIPLAIGFFDARGTLIDVQEMSVASSMMTLDPPIYHSRGPAVFALEMNKGWFARHGIKTGVGLKLTGKTSSSLLSKQLFLNKKSGH